MNPALAADFRQAVSDLLLDFGRPVTHVNASGDEALRSAVIRETQDALSLGTPFPQRQWTAQVSKTAGVAPGDTLIHAGTVTPDDPFPDEVEWRVEGILSDDGMIVTLAIRQVTA